MSGEGRLLEESQRRRLGAQVGLCDRCRHAELADSGRSLFVRCALARTAPRFPRYPLLPVVSCAGYEAR